MTLPLAGAPDPALRLIPSRFPPIGLFDTVATAADLASVMELAGWTNDRLVAERISRLPEREWVFGRPNASVVMAAFLHAPPTGARFSGPDLGAWYAAANLHTAAAEVGHHLRREAASRGLAALSRTYRAYCAHIDGRHVDIRGRQDTLPELYASDSYARSQDFGEAHRASGADGIVYDSVRFAGGQNIAVFRPTLVLDVVQADHYDISVETAARRIEVKCLTG